MANKPVEFKTWTEFSYIEMAAFRQPFLKLKKSISPINWSCPKMDLLTKQQKS